MRAFCHGLLATLILLFAQPLQAQWLSYHTTGVPRTASGAPNLDAPTPRTADGKPDLSGIWEPLKNRPCAVGGCNDMQIPQEFLNIAWGLKSSLPYQPWAAQAVKERMDQYGKDDPVSRCQPPSILQLHTTPLLRKIIQLPGLLVILNEMDVNYRQLFTDGRQLPDDPTPSYTGYSSGKWDGDTLVIETIGFKDGLWIDRNGDPLTDEAKVTERFQRVNYGKMEIEVTVDDPKAYTAPWTVKLTHVIVLDTDLLDYVCQENEQDVSHLIGK
jgi:hypothetical protein